MVLRQQYSKKTLVPQRQRNVIRRNHLIELLYQGISKKITVINAPAGSGKTNVLTDFAAEVGVPVCWYTLSASDKDESSLLDGLMTALTQQFPQIGHTITPILGSSSQHGKQISTIIDSLNYESSLHINSSTLYIMEDFHTLEDESIAKDIINQLIQTSPENCHFIISSRNPVTLPILSKLAMQQQVMRIGANHFAFSVKEIKELFAVVFSSVLSDEQAEIIFTETKGWVPAILFHAATGNSTLTKETRHLSREDLYTYLAEEVYRSLSTQEQEFLSNTAILEELTPEFCDALLEIRNSASILTELYSKNLFITQLNNNKISYQYQTIFKEFLINQLETKNPHHLLVLHYKAGLIFEKMQQWDEAFYHFIKAHKPSEASHILLSVGEKYIRNDKWSVVLSWLDSLPKAQVAPLPQLLLLRAAALVHLGDSAEAARILSELLDNKAYNSDIQLQIKLLNWRCAALRMMGQFSEAKHDIKNAIALVNINGASSDTKGDLYRQLGDICAEQGQLKGALRYQKVALKSYSTSHDLALISQVHNSLGIIYKRCGDLEPAVYHLENAREGWQKLGNYGTLSITLNNISIIYQLKGQYELALDTLKAGLDASRKHGYKRTEACLLLTKGEVLRDAGQYRDAFLSFQKGLDIAREVMEPYFVTYALLGMGEVERLLGNIEKANTLFREASTQAVNHGQTYENALINIQVALIENENNHFESAIKILNQCRSYLLKTGDKNALAKTYFYLAHVSFLNRHYDEIARYISRLEALSKQTGNNEFLVPVCKHAILMLQYCINKKIGVNIFPQILERIKRGSGGRMSQSSKKVETPIYQNIAYLTVSSFGEIKIMVNDREIREEEWQSHRAKEMFMYILSVASEVTREKIITALWPDLSPERGIGNFHINLYRARQALIPVIFTQHGGKYRINPDTKIHYDLFEFRELIRICDNFTGTEKTKCLEKTVSLYKGRFAREIYGDWVEKIRRQTENSYFKCLSLLANLYSEQHDEQKAIAVLERLIRVDPYNDEAYSRIMELQIANNDIVGAKRTYQQYLRDVVKETNIVSPYVSQIFQKLMNTMA